MKISGASLDDMLLLEKITLKKDTQYGGNDGSVAVVSNKNGSKTEGYFKVNTTEDQNSVEIVSERLYKLMGLQIIPHSKVSVRGKTGLLSQWRHDVSSTPKYTEKFLSQLNTEQIYSFCLLYITSAWVNNRDAFKSPNLMFDEDGKMVVLDAGGSFQFRATRGIKPENRDAPVPGFSDTSVGELESLLNYQPGSYLKPLFDRNKKLVSKAKAKLASITDEQIKRAFNGVKFSSTQLKLALVDTLIKRRNIIR